jgi:hypothetical protein
LLQKLQWVEDVEVSGTISWDYNYPGSVEARVEIGGYGTQSGELLMPWQGRIPEAQATSAGKIGNRRITAAKYAP